jgi:hypothetical protein
MYIMTHTTDSAAFLAELATALPELVEFDDKGAPLKANFLKTQTIRKGNETLSLLSVDAPTLAKLKAMKHINVISQAAKWQDIVTKLSAANKATYDRIYDRTPITVTGMDGATETITPPAIWAGFA